MLVCTSANAEVIFDWAHIGNAGNADDIHGDGYGSVDYEYRISKHEVTNSQYIQFLNSVATVEDTYSLYHPDMASTFGGIERSGSGTLDNPYIYSAKWGDLNWLERPVNYVSWADSARFINWLHNGQPNGVQDDTTTEKGAYLLFGAMTDSILVTINRSSNSNYFIPTEDEWYKAAYHKNDGLTGNYYDFPTGDNSSPGFVLDNGTLSSTGQQFSEGINDPNNYATHNSDGDIPGIGGPYYTTFVGEWENSKSPYGTFDQGGNVWEWNEAIIVYASAERGIRGGSFTDDINDLPCRCAIWSPTHV